MTLPVLVRRLRLSEHPSVADAERQARLELTEAVLDHLGRGVRDAGSCPPSSPTACGRSTSPGCTGWRR